jgi:hypothetical protein
LAEFIMIVTITYRTGTHFYKHEILCSRCTRTSSTFHSWKINFTNLKFAACCNNILIDSLFFSFWVYGSLLECFMSLFTQDGCSFTINIFIQIWVNSLG